MIIIHIVHNTEILEREIEPVFLREIMGSETDRERNHTPPKLTLAISRPSKPPESSEMPTPPSRATVSVPFQWEEAPGKPRPCHTESEPEIKTAAFRTLELPPRLLFSEAKVSNLPSPTTVLDGPYVGRSASFTTSYRSPRGLGDDYRNDNFESSRWSNFGKNSRVNNGTKARIIRMMRRRGSFFDTSTHLWASVYESIKQAIPGRRKQEKQRKWTP